MIDVREIRIGIWLQDDDGFFQLEKEFFTLLELNLKNSRPIPLTKEWLIKFGFVWNENGYFEKNHFKITNEMEFLFFNLGDWFQKINYVHQLQNLFFELSNQDLKQ
jgi:hypothetical protein